MALATGTINVDLTLPDTAVVEALTINDGDLLVWRVQAPLTSDQANAIARQTQRLLDRLGKRAASIILDSGMTLDRLTAEQLRAQGWVREADMMPGSGY